MDCQFMSTTCVVGAAATIMAQIVTDIEKAVNFEAMSVGPLVRPLKQPR